MSWLCHILAVPYPSCQSSQGGLAAGCVHVTGLSFLRRVRRSQPSGKCFAITFFRESQQLTALGWRN